MNVQNHFEKNPKLILNIFIYLIYMYFYNYIFNGFFKFLYESYKTYVNDREREIDVFLDIHIINISIEVKKHNV